MAREDLRFPCTYVVDGASVSIRVDNETDFDLTGQWSDTSLVLVEPTGTKLVYRRS